MQSILRLILSLALLLAFCQSVWADTAPTSAPAPVPACCQAPGGSAAAPMPDCCKNGVTVVGHDNPPPAPKAENPGPAPSQGKYWIPGNWSWAPGNSWVWRPGVWVNQPSPYSHWVPGHWAWRPYGNVWVPGHWAW